MNPFLPETCTIGQRIINLMHIWLVQTWEPNPVDDANGRKWRTGILADRLVKKGHTVTWFASNFAHNTKSFRREFPGEIVVSKNLTIWLLNAKGYDRHVSWKRIKDHELVATEFAKVSRSLEKPDLIVASYPTIEICKEASSFAKEFDVPILIDIRDQYPDLFWENKSGLKRMLIKIGCSLYGIQKKARYALSRSDGITANGPEVLNWGLKYATRNASSYDKTLFMSYEGNQIEPKEKQEIVKFWNSSYGISQEDKIVVYAGMLGQTIDFETISEAAKQLPNVKFVICGGGDELSKFQEIVKTIPNCILTGWLESNKIQVLLDIANIGLLPYKPSSNFELGITNKPVEYLSHGLPILTTLQKGVLVDILKSYNAGYTYLYQDTNHLVKIIQDILDDPNLAQRLSHNARLVFNENFHPEIVYETWIALIEALHESRLTR